MVDSTRRNLLLGIGAGVSTAALGSTQRVNADTQSTTRSNQATHESIQKDTDTETVRVRIIHLSPDAPPVDVYLNETLLYQDVTPFNTASSYVNLKTGTHKVTFVPAGKKLDEAVVSTRVSVQANDYTLAAIGEIAECTDTPLRLVQFTDNNSGLKQNSARLQLVHASPDAPSVDIVSAEKRRPLLENVEFGDGKDVTLPAGNYTAIVGTTESNCGGASARIPFTLRGGRVYTAFLEGYLTPDNEPGDKSLVLARPSLVTP